MKNLNLLFLFISLSDCVSIKSFVTRHATNETDIMIDDVQFSSFENNVTNSLDPSTGCTGEFWQPNAHKGRPFVCSADQKIMKTIFILRVVDWIIPTFIIATFSLFEKKTAIPAIPTLVINICFICSFKLDSNQAFSAGMIMLLLEMLALGLTILGFCVASGVSCYNGCQEDDEDFDHLFIVAVLFAVASLMIFSFDITCLALGWQYAFN